MTRFWGIFPYRDPWIMRLPRKKAWALGLFLILGLPFIVIGSLSAIFWLLGYAIFEPSFWLFFAALWVWLLISK